MSKKWTRCPETDLSTRKLKSMAGDYPKVITQSGTFNTDILSTGWSANAKELATRANYTHSYFVTMVVEDKTGFWNFVRRAKLIPGNYKPIWLLSADPKSVEIAGTIFRETKREEMRERGYASQTWVSASSLAKIKD